MSKIEVALILMTLATIALAVATIYVYAGSGPSEAYYIFSLDFAEPTDNYVEFQHLDPWTLQAIANLSAYVKVPKENASEWILYEYTSDGNLAKALVFKYEGYYYRFDELGYFNGGRSYGNILHGTISELMPETKSVFIGPAWVFVGAGWIVTGIIFYKKNKREEL